jgi:dienelactone hydrolase
MILSAVILAIGLAVAQAGEPAVSKEFQSYTVKLLTEAESRCTVTAGGWVQTQRKVREGLRRSLGSDLPRRWPPLDARVEGARRFRGYKIEQVTAEFWPGVRNPMHVFVPDRAGPFPAVVMVCAGAGARSQLYHGLGGALARMGILVLGVQPIGKGVQAPAYRYNGIALLVGTSIAQEQFHTGTRALDYLLARSDVDPKRIGMTGDSCGGWTTLYTSAMDPRVTAAAPASTNYTFCGWLLPDRWRAYDVAEGNLPEVLTYGANIPVVSACNAPKWFRFIHSEFEGDRLQYIPVIDGAARAAYALADASARYSNRIEPCPHGLWPVAQIGVVNWFCEVFLGRQPPEGTLTLAPPPAGSRFETLVADGSPVVDFPDGSPRWQELQVADMPEDDAAGRDGSGFLRIIAARRQDAQVSRAAMARDPSRMLSELARCLGLPSAQLEASAKSHEDLVDLETEPKLHVSGRWVKPPPGKSGRVALVVGKAEDRRLAGDVDAPARFDLALREERLTTSSSGPLWAFAMLNRPPLGMWVWDAMAAANWLRRQGFDVELVGVGDAGALIAPIAAALSHDVASARTVNSHLHSLDEDVVGTRTSHSPYWAHRVLWVSDVPELITLLKAQGRW